jgi:DNA/RNA endonuclease G (NUC1)
MVYVDNACIPYRGMLMCHMIADTSEELIKMAKAIGVQTKWVQYPKTTKEHFDICLSKRTKAVKLGAVELTAKQVAGQIKSKRVKQFYAITNPIPL